MPYNRPPKNRPLFGNYRDLLDDVDVEIAGMKNPDIKERLYFFTTKESVSKDTLDSQPSLIETTYSTLPENLELDLNQLFEEGLQYEIERSAHFKKVLDKCIDLIHEHGGIDSTKGLKNCDNWLSARKEYMEKRAADNLIKLHADENIVSAEAIENKLKSHGWDLNNFLNDILGDEEYAKVQRAIKNKEPRESTAYYDLQWCTKFVKMLAEQNPYFGGSTEYANNETDKYEYSIYHLSTLTRDPSQMYPADSPHARLLKPMLAYNTYNNSCVPYQNQMNLGCGVTEASWDSLSIRFQEAIIARLSDLKDKEESLKGKRHYLISDDWKDMSERIIKMNKMLAPYKGNVNQFATTDFMFRSKVREAWNLLSEEKRKSLYGDISEVPWSSAHIYEDEMDEPINVVGVKGNILLTPNDAAKRYIEKLKSKFGNCIPAGVFPNKDVLSYDEIEADFIKHHQNWYKNAFANKLPIVAGISGHTLGYLNLYSTALKNASKQGRDLQGYPTLEEFRTAIMGALIGNKQHHSYCEALTASVGIPSCFDKQGKPLESLAYNNPSCYGDILNSNNKDIKSVARSAQVSLLNTLDKAMTGDVPQNTVFGKFINGFNITGGQRVLFLNACKKYVATIGMPEKHVMADKALSDIADKCMKFSLQHYKNGVPSSKDRSTVAGKITDINRTPFKRQNKSDSITGKVGQEKHIPITRNKGITPKI